MFCFKFATQSDLSYKPVYFLLLCSLLSGGHKQQGTRQRLYDRFDCWRSQ